MPARKRSLDEGRTEYGTYHAGGHLLVAAPPVITPLARRLRQSRDRRRLTQLQLAKLCHLAPGMISHYETGRREPTLQNLLKMNRVLRADLNKLLEGVMR